MILKLNNFIQPNPKVNKCRKSKNNTANARKNKYCDSSIVPELGHKHQIRTNKLNEHLKDRVFVISKLNENGLYTLKLESGKIITFKRKVANTIKTEHTYEIIRTKGDLVFNPENVYKEVIINDKKIKRKRKVKQVKVLENECIIKLLNCDPVVNDCAFLVRDLRIIDGEVTATVCNGKKLMPEINPIEYIDEVEGGYDYIVVATRKEVLQNSHPLYGYCKDAYNEIRNPTSDYYKGILSLINGEPRAIIDKELYKIIKWQHDILMEDVIPIGEPIEGRIIDDHNKIVELKGMDV